MEIDISEKELNKIRFSTKGQYPKDGASTLERFMVDGLHIGNDSNNYNGLLRVTNKEHADKLIEALQLAIKLGWLE